MGELIQFPIGRVERSPRPAPRPAFFFDVTSPASYLAAERVERLPADVEWVPVDGNALAPTTASSDLTRARTWAEARAKALRLPLVWPETLPVDAPCARRAAAFACELGAGPAFALAASRLAFCGGFDLADPDVITEAAAAAAIPLADTLEAARDATRDEELRDVADLLRAAGVRELPAFRVGEHWLEGESGLAAASELLARREPLRHPLAPVG